MKPLRRLTFALLAAGCLLGLSSCGGGSGSGGGGSSDDGPPQVTVVLAKSAPAVTIGKIAQLVTPLGAFAVGAKVEVPTLDPDAEAIVMATDKDGNIVMAALLSVGHQSADINATTTALTICRLMLGPLPTGVDHVKMNSAIKAAPEFTHLVALIDAAFAAGILPQDYADMGESVSLVLSQASAQVKPVSALSAMASGRLSTPTVTTPLPYIVESAGPFGLFNIKVTAANTSVLGADVSNGFPIQFAAYGTKADSTDALISTGSSSADGYVQLPPAELYKLGAPVPVPGTGHAWNLTVLQTATTRIYNGRKLAADFFGVNLSIAGLNGIQDLCVPKLVTAVISPDAIAPWANASSGEEGWNSYMNYISQGLEWKNASEMLYECAKQALTTLPEGSKKTVGSQVSTASPSVFAQRMAPIFNGTVKLMKGLNKAETAYQIVSLISEGWAFSNYWNYSKTVGICSQTDTHTVIGNCAASLSVTPGTTTGVVGDQMSLSASALDVNGEPTLTPRNLEWASSNPAIAKIDPTTAIVTALSPSATPVTITATDPVTGAKGTATYKVGAVSASLTVAPQSIALGGTSTLIWSSENATGCTGSGAWNGALATSGTRAVSPLATGTYNYGLSCDGPGGPAVASTSVTVTQPPTGGTTYNYVGLEFNETVRPDVIFVPGRLKITVTFKTDMRSYSGTANRDTISSIKASVDGTGYFVDSTNSDYCPWGLSDARFEFKNGVITSWYMQQISKSNWPKCELGAGWQFYSEYNSSSPLNYDQFSTYVSATGKDYNGMRKGQPGVWSAE